MPRKNTRRPSERPDDSTVLLVHIEDIKAQNRLTIEAVHNVAQALDKKLEERFEGVDHRLDALESAVRRNSDDIRRNSEDIDGLKQGVARLETKVDKIDTRLQVVEVKVDSLIPLEARVTALERKPA
jgi:chromosome segregation ATPase